MFFDVADASADLPDTPPFVVTALSLFVSASSPDVADDVSFDVESFDVGDVAESLDVVPALPSVVLVLDDSDGGGVLPSVADSEDDEPVDGDVVTVPSAAALTIALSNAASAAEYVDAEPMTDAPDVATPSDVTVTVLEPVDAFDAGTIMNAGTMTASVAAMALRAV
ncbi:hypothetical protein [Bifidobacterium primatium]|uniref:hypothetical protein n=1 Tax=Bifidobacterium primatium TaxID=2045438 RepID=UPI0013FDF239|nr:hypothetical protein [Bifidobacterium primatium]